MTDTRLALRRHQAQLRRCHRCPDMLGPVVVGAAVVSSVYLIGQAPGEREIGLGRPFAWTAGRTLFRWFEGIGVHEQAFRQRVYMAAVCRCFPGKNPRGGDRVPSPQEVDHCGRWLAAELQLLQPRLVLPVGKLAIAQLMPVQRLDQVVGTKYRLTVHGITFEAVPLPHPSGASVWHRTEPGKSLLRDALACIDRHSAWRALRGRGS